MVTLDRILLISLQFNIFISPRKKKVQEISVTVQTEDPLREIFQNKKVTIAMVYGRGDLLGSFETEGASSMSVGDRTTTP